MTTRTITKALAGKEDLTFGQGVVTQTRNGVEYSITKINSTHIPYSGETAGLDLVTVKEKFDSLTLLNAMTGVYDFSVNGGAVGNITLGIIPDNSVIIEAWYEVITAPTSSGSATIALGIETDGVAEILDAKAFDDTTWMSLGFHDTLIFPRAANFTTKTTGARNVVLTIGTDDLTAGLIYFWCRYITSV